MTTVVVEELSEASSGSGVSWPAIAAGALAAVAGTLILLALGSGFGLATASPWGDTAKTAAKIGVGAAIWVVVVQWIASALAGYITGRLRTRWARLHSHEVFFRDTAHGLLAWALATVLIAVVAASVGVTSSGAAGAATQAASTINFTYDADTLYRTSGGDLNALAPARAEAARMLSVGALQGGVTADDRAYLISAIATRTGIAPAAAQQRLDNVQAREQQQMADLKAAADKAREAAAALAILTAISMLVGAFIASVAGILGGQLRDLHP